MGNGGRKGSGGSDMVVESRHLVGLFLGVVLLCGVFFTLGYVMGRTQYDSSVRAAALIKEKAPGASSPTAQDRNSAPMPGPSDWDFYRSAQPVKTPGLPPQPGVTTAAGRQPAVPSAASPRSTPGKIKPFLRPPLIPRGAIVLQLAALTRQGDALAIAEALQRKNYPAFVLTPASDNLYRIQVGPYADAQSAEVAKRSLEREGFKAIVKR